MRHLKFSLFSLATLLLLGGCAAVNEPATRQNDFPAAAYRAYFYPLKNGLQYTYVRTVNNGGSTSTAVSDTVTYQLLLSNNKSTLNSLVTVSGDRTKGKILYNFAIGKEADADAAILSDSLTKFYALRGTLEDGTTWIADSVHGTTATVFAHYDAYMLPDRKTSYNDVITVKYQGANPNEFCLRYFARDNGLILERFIQGGSTEVSNLRLVKVQNAPTLSQINFPGPTSSNNGLNAARAVLQLPDELKK